jgi:hypothetical protein
MLIDRLPFHRAKNRVREKIVELGLVEDVKELRKKRVHPGKSGGREESNRDESDEDVRTPREGPSGLRDSESDESEQESDEEESDGEPVNRTKHKKEPKTNRPKLVAWKCCCSRWRSYLWAIPQKGFYPGPLPFEFDLAF